MNDVRWNWPKASLSGGADGSAMSKLFRGGALNDAALLAREAIQNSSDAHERYKVTHPSLPFKMIFRFVHLYGDEKADAVAALDLRGMREHENKYEIDPLQPGSILTALDDPAVPLKLLFVEDWGTHGLSGDPMTAKMSHLFMAMYYLGSSTKSADEGGLYGFGKSALQRASRTRTVLAHSTFAPTNDDPVHTRLLGFTWWPDLQDGNTLLEGRGSFCDGHQPADQAVPRPFADAEANAVATALGFRHRDPHQPTDHGTSFLIIDPAVEPDDLLHQVETWWWPALEEHRLDVRVIRPGGEATVPKPASNSAVAPFLRPFHIASGLNEPSDPNSERLASKEWRDRGAGGKDLGTLALVVAEPHDPAEDDEDGVGETTIVALMRNPRMVVEYMEHPKRRVTLRGVFIASDSANKILRDTEPSTHDRWTTNASADVSSEATDVARALMSKIRHSVLKMTKEIAPPPPKSEVALNHFAKLLGGLTGSKRGKHHGSPGGGEPIELTFPDGRPGPTVLDDTDVAVRTRFTVRIADKAPGSACEVLVDCRMFIYEDESQSQSRWPVTTTPVGDAHGFLQEDDGSWSGLLTRDDKVTFEVSSDPYPNLWTISLQPTAVRTGEWMSQ